MYQIVTGPLLWLSFAIFFGGCLFHVINYFKGLDSRVDRVTYKVNTRHGVRAALRSIGVWILPFGTRSWRVKPGYTLLFYLFHVGALSVPLFASGHAVIITQRWGLNWPSMPDMLADALTLGVMLAVFGIFIRRLILPEVRIISSGWDWLTLAISAAPFFTGFIAYHQLGSGHFWTLAHILFGEILLIAVPFTKLFHMVLFFCTRIQIGMDFGIKRGGMKSPGFPW
ncbi:MAG: hypothetical protein MI742_17285 [Desulfobacterales bacterium]|nr:hypothetical protein [Desulfobacterales bacterium]